MHSKITLRSGYTLLCTVIHLLKILVLVHHFMCIKLHVLVYTNYIIRIVLA